VLQEVVQAVTTVRNFKFLTFEYGLDWLSRNVGKKLPPLAA